MKAVAVGGLHDHVICGAGSLWVFDQWLIDISNIAGEDQFFGNAVLSDPYFNGSGTEQMAHISETNVDAFA